MVIIISFCEHYLFLPAKPFLWSDVGYLCVKAPKKNWKYENILPNKSGDFKVKTPIIPDMKQWKQAEGIIG